MSLLAILLLGFFLGVRHATDSDHVVAVTTIVSRARSAQAAVGIGLLWGLGHTVTLLTVGGGIVAFGWVIPPRLGLSLEMAVAVMLIVLGALNLRGALARGGGRTLTVGLVHGLSGSAAIALLVLGTIKSVGLALLYLAVFSVGTLAGMMLLTGLMALPLSAMSSRFHGLERVLGRVTGVLSLAMGLFLAYRIGVSDGLLFGTPNWTPR